MFTKVVNFIVWFLVGWTLTSLLITKCAEAATYLNTKKYHVLDVEEFSTDIFQIADRRTGFADQYQEDWDKGVAFNFNLRFLYNALFLDNTIDTYGTKSQLREAGWRWRAGANVTDWLQVFYQHHSSHLLDEKNENTKFVLENYYGVRLYFKKENK